MTPAREALELEAYEEYKRYVANHRPTRANPLRTYAGWLREQNLKLTISGNAVTISRCYTSGTRS